MHFRLTTGCTTSLLCNKEGVENPSTSVQMLKSVAETHERSAQVGGVLTRQAGVSASLFADSAGDAGEQAGFPGTNM